MRQLLSALCLLVAAIGMRSAPAAPVNIDFQTYAPLSSVPTAQGVSFSVSGGPGPAGIPVTEEFQYGLSNSTTGYFPTSNYLDFAFQGLASNVSYTFNNFGDGGVDGVGYTFATYFGANGVVLGTQELAGAVTQLISVDYSDIAAIRFDNNSDGRASWLFSVSSLTADVSPASEIPEPDSFALVLAGLVALTYLSRRSRRNTP